jgi:hypothetical protein
MKWIALILIALAARIAWVRWRHLGPAQRRVQRFLTDRGIVGVRVHAGGHYGWPVYFLHFRSENEREEFRNSPTLTALIEEIRRMHQGLRLREVAFDASQAVVLRSPT